MAGLERQVRSRDPETSYVAALAMDRRKTRGLSDSIYDLLLTHGPQTDDALYKLYRAAGGTRTPQRVRTARAELVRGTEALNPTVRATGHLGVSEHGGPAQIWQAIH